MGDFIVFILFFVLMLSVSSGALGMYAMGEKGKSTSKGFVIGFFAFLIGPLLIFILVKDSDQELVTKMYDQELISFKDFKEKTQEVKLKTQEIKIKK